MCPDLAHQRACYLGKKKQGSRHGSGAHGLSTMTLPTRVLARACRFHTPGVPEARARASASGAKLIEERLERPKLGMLVAAAGSAPGAKQTEERRESPKVGGCLTCSSFPSLSFKLAVASLMLESAGRRSVRRYDVRNACPMYDRNPSI